MRLHERVALQHKLDAIEKEQRQRMGPRERIARERELDGDYYARQKKHDHGEET